MQRESQQWKEEEEEEEEGITDLVHHFRTHS